MSPFKDNAQQSTLAAGCLFASASALTTGLMLFVNGSLVMAILAALEGVGPVWLRKREVDQFILFSLPVLLAIIQWKMIDYVRTRFRRRTDPIG